MEKKQQKGDKYRTGQRRVLHSDRQDARLLFFHIAQAWQYFN